VDGKCSSVVQLIQTNAAVPVATVERGRTTAKADVNRLGEISVRMIGGVDRTMIINLAADIGGVIVAQNLGHVERLKHTVGKDVSLNMEGNARILAADTRVIPVSRCHAACR